MTFSPEFENALHFIANVDGGKLERMADKIVQEYELDAKNNPKFASGMFVIVFNRYRQFVGHGRIVGKPKWGEECSRYYHDVEIFDESTSGATYVSQNVRDDQMECFWLTPKVSGDFKRRFAVDGGLA